MLYLVFPCPYVPGICPTSTDSFKSAVKEAAAYISNFGVYCRIKNIR